MTIEDVTLGADVELFLKDLNTNQIVSAEGYVKGQKYDPFHFDETNNGFILSLDNVLAEFGIPPVRKEEDWMANIKKAVQYIDSSIPPHLCTVAVPATTLDEMYLRSEQAKRFGCEPDYNVWLRNVNPPPTAPNKQLRSAGGHVHVGYRNPECEGLPNAEDEAVLVRECIIKAFDLFLGVPSILQEPDNDRKQLYGKAGAFRFKEYGVEYRTLSNYYLSDDKLLKWVYDNAMAAINFINEGRINEVEEVGDQIQEAINKNNKVLAGNLINQFNLVLA